jgi:hypothetical protein
VAGIGGEGVEQLVELHRIGRVRDRDRAPVAQRRRARAAGRQVDVEVPLEEQPGPDLERGVGSDRLPASVDLHRQLAQVGLAIAPDPRHLAHVDPPDPHRRPRPEQVRALNHGVDRVVVAEGQGLGEDEVRGEDQDHDPDQARLDWRQAAFGEPHGSTRFVCSVDFWLIGAGPITTLPGS